MTHTLHPLISHFVCNSMCQSWEQTLKGPTKLLQSLIGLKPSTRPYWGGGESGSPKGAQFSLRILKGNTQGGSEVSPIRHKKCLTFWLGECQFSFIFWPGTALLNCKMLHTCLSLNVCCFVDLFGVNPSYFFATGDSLSSVVGVKLQWYWVCWRGGNCKRIAGNDDHLL